MKTPFPIPTDDEPIREAGLAMAHADLEVVPVVDDTGALTGVLTERALARRYVRETRHTSTLEEAPTRVTAVVSALGGELLTGEDRRLSGRVWVHSMDVESRSGISPGDVVVVGDRSEAQLRAIELGAALVVISNSASPTEEVLRARSCPWNCCHPLGARQLCVGSHDHARGAMRRPDGKGPDHGRARLPARGRLRADQGEPLRRRGGS